VRPQIIPVTKIASVIKEELDERYYGLGLDESVAGDFVARDPVRFPRHFAGLHQKNFHAKKLSREERADIEVAAFLAATIAWGQRKAILASAERMFALMGGRPGEFVLSGDFGGLPEGCVHRTFFGNDLRYFCRGLKFCYDRYDSLENLFAGAGGLWQGIALFRREMAAGNRGTESKHVANPEGGAACKRINLALRWLVRGDAVDIGLWSKVSPAELRIPLDVHVARGARKLGLLQRKSNDRKAVEELTEALRGFCPEDPVRYDLALFEEDRLGDEG